MPNDTIPKPTLEELERDAAGLNEPEGVTGEEGELVTEGDGVIDGEPEAEPEEGTLEEGAEVEEAEAQKSVEPAATKHYTPDELAELLDNEEADFDRNRLTSEGKIIHRTLERHTQRKWQELAGIKKQVEQYYGQLQEMGEKMKRSAPPPTTIEEAYDRDPDGTMEYLDREVIRLSNLREGQEGYEKALELINHINSQKSNLVHRGMRQSAENQALERRAQIVETAMVRDFPEIVQHQSEIVEFAMKELGLTEADLKFTDPMVSGEAAYRFTGALCKMFKKGKAPATIEKKAATKKPTQTLKPSSPAPSNAGSLQAQITTLEKKVKANEGTSDDMHRLIMLRSEMAEQKARQAQRR